MNGFVDTVRLDLASRRVLGFDIRISLSKLAHSFRSPPPTRSLLKHILFPLTLDTELWPSVLDLEFGKDTDQIVLNGYNLLFDLTDDVLKRAAAQNEPFVLGAFDISSSTYESLRGTFGDGWNKPGGTSQDLIDAGWILMGFDVVDPRTQLSGFFSFDFSPEEQAKIQDVVGAAMTPFGLLARLDNAKAQAAAALLGSLIPEHGPFSACGVWLALEQERRRSNK